MPRPVTNILIAAFMYWNVRPPRQSREEDRRCEHFNLRINLAGIPLP